MAQKPRRHSAALLQTDDISVPGNPMDTIRNPSRRSRAVTPPPPAPEASPTEEEKHAAAMKALADTTAKEKAEKEKTEADKVEAPKAPARKVGRPKQYDLRMSISFPSNFGDDVKALAWKEDVSPAVVIRRAVREYLLTHSDIVMHAHEMRSAERKIA